MAALARGGGMTNAAAPLEHADVRALGDDAWLGRLVASIDQPVQDGKVYAGFPDEGTQKAFVGSAFSDALGEANRFYLFVRNQMRGAKLKPAGRYLDFGCGWGRIGRFFLRDFERGDIAGVDIDPGMVEFCREASAPGSFHQIFNGEPLPFDDGAFKVVTAYSVFTHLPEPLFRAWMDELLRVTAPGGLIVFTVEPRRFLDFVAAIDPDKPESGWHAALHSHLGDAGRRQAQLASQGFTYLPTGGGPYRPADVYGDMVVQPDFIRQVIARKGTLVRYVDDSRQFWQAVAVVRRRGTSIFDRLAALW